MTAGDLNHHADVAIIGGGIAGLWLHATLREAGYHAVLIEKNGLGSGQTLASQGMIHGGIKYTLNASLSASSESIRDMPAVWRECFNGTGQLDLSRVPLLSDRYYLFSDDSAGSRLTTFLGSKALRGRINKVKKPDIPELLSNESFRGTVYQLHDFVVDTRALLQHFLDRYGDSMIAATPEVVKDESGRITHLDLGPQALTAERYIFTAGEGNEALLQSLPDAGISSQRRPLQQVMLSHPDLPDAYAHAIRLALSATPRLTMTTHRTESGAPVWYLGGELAELGVDMTAETLIDTTREELAKLFPWLNLSSAKYATLPINRAEPGTATGHRPDTPFCESWQNVMVCWPTKLTLTPGLATAVMKQIDFAPTQGNRSMPQLPRPVVAKAPWDNCGF